MFYWYSLLIIFRYQARTSMHTVNVATKDNECWSKKKDTFKWVFWKSIKKFNIHIGL